MSGSIILVVPGQVLAVSQRQDEASQFLRGHGTYVEAVVPDDNDNDNDDDPPQDTRLVASTVGLVQRVNKLVSVQPLSERGAFTGGQVGDLVVGRVTAVAATRWTVSLGGQAADAALPLAGVYLPGGAQRMRTAQDARVMREFLKQGDLVAAEIHKTGSGGGGGSTTQGYQLHTRSSRYGKLENGCLVTVPAFLVPRRKQHVSTLPCASPDGSTVTSVLIIFGCNGYLWMQRDVCGEDALPAGGPELVEWHQKQQATHASTPYAPPDRQALSRLSNCVQILVTAKQACTVEHLERLYKASLVYESPARLLHPDVVVELAGRLQKSKLSPKE